MWRRSICLYVRELGMAEERRLQRIAPNDRNRIKVRRAQVILASAQGPRVPQIAEQSYFCEAHLRAIIKQFNREGFTYCAFRMFLPPFSGNSCHLCSRLRREGFIALMPIPKGMGRTDDDALRAAARPSVLAPGSALESVPTGALSSARATADGSRVPAFATSAALTRTASLLPSRRPSDAACDTTHPAVE